MWWARHCADVSVCGAGPSVIPIAAIRCFASEGVLMKDRWVWRSRWAAVGAAVAVSIGGGGLFLASAAPGVAESTVVMVSPARVLDSRDPNNLGLSGPFVSAVSQKLKVTGAIPTSGGVTTVVPAGATGVLLNVTAASPAAAGFVSIRPGDATGVPKTSSLNVEAGKNVPNAVQVALPTSGANAGQIDITYDAYGTAGPSTDLLIDIVGYLTNTGLQELVNAQHLTNTGLQELVKAAPIAKSAYENDVSPDPNGTSKVLLSLTIVAPVAGIIQMSGNTQIFDNGVGGTFICHFSEGAGATLSINSTRRFEAIPAGGEFRSCSTNGSLAVAAGTYIVNFVGYTPVGGDLDATHFDVHFIAGGTLTAADVGAASDDPPKVRPTP